MPKGFVPVLSFLFSLSAAACDGEKRDEVEDPEAAVSVGDQDASESGAAREAGTEPADSGSSTAMDAGMRDAGGASDAGGGSNDAGGSRDAAQARDTGATNPSDAQVSASDASVRSARVFYFGHSLVDQDMPKMVGSLASARGKTYTSQGQLGWGTQLRDHFEWDGDFGDAPLGFPEENQGRSFFAGEGKAQLRMMGRYDVLVLTESNGHTRGDGNETVDYATRLIEIARQANPTIRVYLYSNWLDRSESEFGDDDAWRTKTEADIAWWESVADRINARINGPDIFVIPGSVLLSRVTREVAMGRLSGLTVDGLFREGDGVHVNDRGFYVIALAHYAAIFRDTPVGLPAQTETEDGPAEAHTAQNAMRLQQLVWDYIRGYARAGISQ